MESPVIVGTNPLFRLWLSFRRPVHQLSNLLRHQTNQKNGHRRTQQEDRCQGQAPVSKKCECVIAHTNQCVCKSNRRKEFQRRVQRPDLENYQQKADAIAPQTNMAFRSLHSRLHVNRLVGHCITCPEEGHGNGGRIRKSVRQKIQKLKKLLAPHRPETGGQILYRCPTIHEARRL